MDYRLASATIRHASTMVLLVSTSALADRPAPEPPLQVHEAIRSADGEPVLVDRAPPTPLNERAILKPPGPRAITIPGYWGWDGGDFVWVPGLQREPPAGRFWANGYWRRETGGWSRVPGFWTDRRLDRIAWRPQGPPATHPEDRAGPAPSDDHFFIPGHYKADGVTWQPGFWAKAQPSWVWEPARWVRQPEGWTLQEGFWDRPVEERGTKLTLVRDGEASKLGDTAYQPPPLKFGPNSPTPGQTVLLSGGPLVPPAGLATNPGAWGPSSVPRPGPADYFNQTLSVLNNGPNYASFPPSNFGGYPYYGYGIGTNPGYYGGSSFGPGLGFYPGYYGGTGFEAGKAAIQQGGLGGYPYYGHGLGFYPGYFGP